MTLEKFIYGVSVQYARRTTLEHQALLEERLRHVRREMRAAAGRDGDGYTKIEECVNGLVASIGSNEPHRACFCSSTRATAGAFLPAVERPA
jgi:hypothetical protein